MEDVGTPRLVQLLSVEVRSSPPIFAQEVDDPRVESRLCEWYLSYPITMDGPKFNRTTCGHVVQ